MTNLWGRLRGAFRSRAGSPTDEPTQPARVPEQREALVQARKAIAEASQARREIEREAGALSDEMASLAKLAKEAVAEGKDDLAREIIAQHVWLGDKLAQATKNHAEAAAKEEQLAIAATKLRVRLESAQRAGGAECGDEANPDIATLTLDLPDSTLPSEPVTGDPRVSEVLEALRADIESDVADGYRQPGLDDDSGVRDRAEI